MKKWKLALAALLILACTVALPALAEGLQAEDGEIIAAPIEAVVAESEDLALAPEDGDADAAAVAAPSQVAINATNFPDDNFRSRLAEACDKDNDGILSSEELSCEWLDLSENSITSIKGIEYFAQLKSLYCQDNAITSLDLSQNGNLTKLNCNNNQLTTLDVSMLSQLSDLDCVNNALSNLELSGCGALTGLDCSSNQLTGLDFSGCPLLRYLDCSHNQMTGTLDVYDFPISYLDCSYNQLTSLSISGAKLEKLFCQNNLLTSLHLKGNDEGYVDGLYTLDCSNNRLTSLTLEGDFYWLRYMYIQNNRLALVDVGDCYDIRALAMQHQRVLSEDGKWITFINNNYVYKEDGSLFDGLAGDCLVSDVTTSVYMGSRLLYQGAPRDIAECTATVKNKTYTGAALEPAVTVTYDGNKLVEGTDYTVRYTDNTNAGTATATITGQGGYAGTKAVTFRIARRKLSAAKVATVKAQAYNGGKAIKPDPALTYKGVALVKGTDYKLSYANNKKVGVATITITGKGNFSGKRTLNFKINPKPTDFTGMKAGKAQFTAQWEKLTAQVTGYQLQYGLKSSFSGAKKITIASNKTTKKTVKGLQGGKVYYVRVRTYYKANGKTYYSAWCEPMRVKASK